MINIILQKLVNTFNINTNNPSANIDLAYELLSASIAFNKSPFYIKENGWNIKEINSRITNNSQDGKIDAFNIRNYNECIVIELLQSKNTSNVSTNDIGGYFTSIKNYIIDLNDLLPSNHQSLEKVQTLIKDYLERYSTYSVKYKVNIAANSFSEVVQRDIQTMFDNTFSGYDVELKLIDNHLIENGLSEIQNKITNENYSTTKVTISFDQNTRLRDEGQSKILIGVMNAKEIFKLIDEEFNVNYDLSRLFSSNVRGFLETSPVNDQIKNTILNRPKTFLSLNNGAVILCDKIESRPTNSFVITNPNIINGQQTIASIYKYAKTNQIQQNVNVQVKIIELSERHRYNAQNDISRSSNQANTIENIDLLANKPLIKNLRKFFWEKGLFLNVKQGDILNDVFFEPVTKVNITDIIKMWVSVYLKRPNDAKTTKKIIKIFIDGYDNKEPYNLMVKDSNHDFMCTMFYSSYIAIKKLNEFSNRYLHESFFEHAKYFLMFILSQTNGYDFEILNENDFDNAINKVKACIDIERSRTTEYSHNNYFKSSRPINDYDPNKLNRLTFNLEILFQENISNV